MLSKRSSPPRTQHNKDQPLHRGRIIVRNISFKATEDSLRAHFEQFGAIEDVKLLRKSDGKLVGCGFVQFTNKQNAAKAIHHTTFKPFLGRPIVADWAVPKGEYLNKERGNVSTKSTPGDSSDQVIVKEEQEEVSVKDEIVEEKVVDDDEKVVDDDKSSEFDDSDEDDKNTQQIKQETIKDETTTTENRKKYESHDVSEGKTVFVKNIPFQATNDDLKQVMRQFGRVYYALICRDRLTEFSKGTGFVKFVNKNDADACLQAGTELKLHDNVLDCHVAVDRSTISAKRAPKPTATSSKSPSNAAPASFSKKDSRHLYLAKEGVVLANSPAAEGVSHADMSKRLMLEQTKSQMLRNLNMFVSPTRLVVHNVPFSYDDQKLRALLKKHTSKTAKITECKIMREKNILDKNNVGKSKGYGFVTFTAHDDALKALRNLNNNPTIFSEKRRPIVGFSVENRVMLNAKLRRAEKSKRWNPLCKEYNPQEVAQAQNNTKKEIVKLKRNKVLDKSRGLVDNAIANASDNDKTGTPSKNRAKKNAKKLANKNESNAPVSDNDKFIGFASRPGHVQKLRNKRKLTNEATVHLKNLKKLKKQKNKAAGRSKVAPMTSKKRKNDDDNFGKLVNKYKESLNSSRASNQVKNKWYDK